MSVVPARCDGVTIKARLMCPHRSSVSSTLLHRYQREHSHLPRRAHWQTDCGTQATARCEVAVTVLRWWLEVTSTLSAARATKAAVIRDDDTLETVSVNRLPGTFDATPIAVGNELFLRSWDTCTASQNRVGRRGTIVARFSEHCRTVSPNRVAYERVFHVICFKTFGRRQLLP